jgi:hypothetical protein
MWVTLPPHKCVLSVKPLNQRERLRNRSRFELIKGFHEQPFVIAQIQKFEGGKRSTHRLHTEACALGGCRPAELKNALLRHRPPPSDNGRHRYTLCFSVLFLQGHRHTGMPIVASPENPQHDPQHWVMGPHPASAAGCAFGSPAKQVTVG